MMTNTLLKEAAHTVGSLIHDTVLPYIFNSADVMGDDDFSETFRVLKTSEYRQFGELRKQRLVLAAWDRLVRGEA